MYNSFCFIVKELDRVLPRRFLSFVRHFLKALTKANATVKFESRAGVASQLKRLLCATRISLENSPIRCFSGEVKTETYWKPSCLMFDGRVLTIASHIGKYT